MFRTMNGNVKTDIAKTTDGRLNSASVFGDPERAEDRRGRAAGQQDERIPNAMYSAPNIGNTISARTIVRYRTLRTKM